MSDLGVAAGVVLAAGAGRRYGIPKVLAAEGKWLQDAVTSLVDGGCVDVVVVLGAAAAAVPPPARTVVADDWVSGMAASLRAGLAAVADADTVVIRLVDTPDVSAAVIRRVLAQAASSGLARATYGGRPGHPVVIARRHVPDFVTTLTGDEGGRDFLAARAELILVECGDLATGRDVDESPNGSPPPG